MSVCVYVGLAFVSALNILTEKYSPQWTQHSVHVNITHQDKKGNDEPEHSLYVVF